MVELQIVILVVAGSSPVGHPIFFKGLLLAPRPLLHDYSTASYSVSC